MNTISAQPAKERTDQKWSISLWWLTTKALLLFLLIDAGLYFFGFDRVTQRALAGSKRSKRRVGSAEDPYVGRAVAAVQIATRMYYRNRLDCLPKSLALFLLLKKKVHVDFCLGVKKFPFAGHAWIEYQGQVIGDSPTRIRAYTLLSRSHS